MHELSQKLTINTENIDTSRGRTPLIETVFVLAAKIFPTILQFLFAALGVTTRIMRHVLRRDESNCPFLLNKLESTNEELPTKRWRKRAKQLGRLLRSMPCLESFSTEATRLQSTVGLGLTLFTSIWLSESRQFTIVASSALIALIIGYVLMLDFEKRHSVDEKGLFYAFGCTIVGVVFVIASTVT